jgi:hypothetical protein
MTQSRKLSGPVERKVMITALVPIGIGEVGFCIVALAFLAIRSTFDIVGFGVLYTIVIGSIVAIELSLGAPTHRIQARLSKWMAETSSPHRTRLYLEIVRQRLAFLNVFILMIGTFAIIISRMWNPYWAFYAGACGAVAVFYNRSVLNLFGQRYDDNRGASFVLAASLSNLASKMFSDKKKGGLTPMIEALRMTRTLFTRKGLRPKSLEEVWMTINSLDQRDDLPFQALDSLAHSIQELPRRDQLPEKLGEFLDSLGWARGFELIPKKKDGMSKGEFLNIVFTSIIAIGSILAVIGGVLQGLVPSFSQYLGQQVGSVIAIFVLAAGFVYSFRADAYSVPFYYARKYLR